MIEEQLHYILKSIPQRWPFRIKEILQQMRNSLQFPQSFIDQIVAAPSPNVQANLFCEHLQSVNIDEALSCILVAAVQSGNTEIADEIVDELTILRHVEADLIIEQFDENLSEMQPSKLDSNCDEEKFIGNWPLLDFDRFYVRRNEYSALLNSIRNIRIRRSGLLYIHGPNGVGKTSAVAFVARYWRNPRAERIRATFDRIIWLNASSISKHRYVVDEMYKTLVHSKLIEQNTKKTIDSIGEILHRKRLKILFIIDDVSDSYAFLDEQLDSCRSLQIIAVTRSMKYNHYQLYFELTPLTNYATTCLLQEAFKLVEQGVNKDNVELLSSACDGLPQYAVLIQSQFRYLESQTKIENMCYQLTQPHKTMNLISRIAAILPSSSAFVDPKIQLDLLVFLLFPLGSVLSHDVLKILRNYADDDIASMHCQEAVKAGFLHPYDSGFQMYSNIFHAIEFIAKKNDPSQCLKTFLIELLLTDHGGNCFKDIVIADRPELLRLFIENASSDAICKFFSVEVALLLVSKCIDGELWLANVGSQTESSVASKLLCKLLDLVCRRNEKFLNVQLVKLIGQTMGNGNKWYQNIFFAAIMYECRHCMKHLLNCDDIRKKLGSRDIEGNNALILAAKCRLPLELFKELMIAHQFNVNETNKRGETALWHICSQRTADSISKIELLREQPEPLDSNIADCNGATALHKAVEGESLEIVKYLVKYLSADVNIRATGNRCGRNALELSFKPSRSANNNSSNIARYLLSIPDAKISSAFFREAISVCKDDNYLVAKIQSKMRLTDSETNTAANLNKKESSNGKILAKSNKLFSACSSGDAESVKNLLAKGTNADERNIDGWTPLMLASAGGYHIIVNLLLSNWAQTDYQNNRGQTALMLASENGHQSIVCLLIHQGANIFLRNDQGHTALISACKYGHEDIFSLLLHHLNFDYHEDEDSHKQFQTAFWCACQGGHWNIAEKLIQKGAKVNMPDEQGRTALIYSCQSGSWRTVKLLLDTHANINAEDNLGHSAILYAHENQHCHIVELLLRRGAKLHNPQWRVLKGDELWASLQKVCRTNDFDSFLEHAKNQIIDVNISNEEGDSLLMLASFSGSSAIVKYLIDRKAEVDAKSSMNGSTALSYAARQGHAQVVQLLIDSGASVSKPNNFSWTPLHLASFNGHRKCIEIICSKDAETINAVNYEGSSALILAATGGHADAVKSLVGTFKAKFNVSNSKGITPLMAACQKGHDRVVIYLLNSTRSLNLNAIDAIGMSALMWAAFYGHEYCITLLANLEDCDLNIQDTIFGNTCLHFAIERGFTSSAAAILRIEDSLTSTVNYAIRTPLMAACSTQSITDANYQSFFDALLKISIENGVSLYQTDDEGLTALSLACLHGNNVAIQLMLPRVHDVNFLDETQSSLMIYAAKGNNKEAAALLLQRNANLDLQDEFGRTALMYAAEMGHLDMIVFLIENGANLLIKDNRGSIALALAIPGNNTKVISTFLKQCEAEQKQMRNSCGETLFGIATRLDCNDEVISLFQI